MNDANQFVAIDRCNSYDPDQLAGVIDRVAKAAQFGDDYHGKIVLLKPNLISSSGSNLACTHRYIISGVAVWFKNRGARVMVGDSPAFGSAQRVCGKFGIDRVLKKLDVKIVNFDSGEKRELPGGIVLPVARQVLECDFFVGLPKIKAHNQMFVTLALKNVFGIVTGVNKAMLHMIHGSSHKQFAEIILDLLTVLPAHVHIADGIEVMHRSGPLDGETLGLHCIAASWSPVALDTAILDALELDETRSPLMQVARARGYRESSREKLTFPLKNPEHFHGSGFQAPEELNPIRFNPFRFLHGAFRRALLRMSS